ncbi:hypothetical protein F9K97_13195 [Brucella anthropi]|nr:hypothetical protein F9K97_13195 [Brucella anthropi]
MPTKSGRVIRAFPVLLESLKMAYVFSFTHYPTQNRSALLLEMLLPAHFILPSWAERAQLHRRHSRVQRARHVPD